MGDRDPNYRSKVIVKLSRPINVEKENAPHLPSGKPTNYRIGTGTEYDDPCIRITDMRGNIAGQRSKSPGRSVWLLKTPLSAGGDVFWRPHYRPHNVLCETVDPLPVTAYRVAFLGSTP